MHKTKRSYLGLWLLLLAGAVALAMFHDYKKQKIEDLLVGYARFQPFEVNIKEYYAQHRKMPQPEEVFHVTGLDEWNASCHLAGHCPVYYERFENNSNRSYMSVLLEQKETSARIFKAYVGDPVTGQVTVFCGPWDVGEEDSTSSALQKVYPQCQSDIKQVLGL